MFSGWMNVLIVCLSFGSRINKSVKRDGGLLEKRGWWLDFFVLCFFLHNIWWNIWWTLGGCKMHCSRSLVFWHAAACCDLQYFPEIYTLQFASKTGIKCSRLTWMSQIFLLIYHPYGIRHVRYIALFEFTSCILTHEHNRAELKYLVHFI